MARPIRVTVGSVAASSSIILNTYNTPLNLGLGVKLDGATTGTYSVEHTFDDPFASGFASSAVWYPYTDLTSKTANADGNYSFPVTAVRLNVSVISSGAGTAPNTITMTVIPAGR
jgi:hypothetical protein